MKKIKLELSGMDTDELVGFVRRSQTKLEGDTTFTSLNSDVTKLGVAATLLEKRQSEFKLSEQETAAKLDLVAKQRVEVERLANVVGLGVQHTAGGNTEILRAGPFALQSPPTPLGPLAAPDLIRLSPTETEGDLLVRWKGVRGAKAYLIEYCLEGSTEWLQGNPSTRARTVLTGLVSGKKYRVRVRALGTSGPSPWSNEALKMAA